VLISCFNTEKRGGRIQPYALALYLIETCIFSGHMLFMTLLCLHQKISDHAQMLGNASALEFQRSFV